MANVGYVDSKVLSPTISGEGLIANGNRKLITVLLFPSLLLMTGCISKS